jgi:hypothetical protein
MASAMSLGYNCNSAIKGVRRGIRNTKLNGYKTCVFDEMISNYKGIIDCINDDFLYLCNTNYLTLKTVGTDVLIYNTKYKFIFNHESPGHANLYITQKWSKGINHYVMNNYEEFITRYNRRIQNVKELLNSNKHITFILTRPNTQMCDISELNATIKNKYPFLTFSFIFLKCDKSVYRTSLLDFMGCNENDDEVKRLE